MQTVNIKKKELNIKYPARLIVEDEVRAEPIKFVILEASDITNHEALTFFLQYRNNLGEYGFENLEQSYDESADQIILIWEPSALFTKEKGKVEIQIFGSVSFYTNTPDTAFLADKEYYVQNHNVYSKLLVHKDGHTSPYVGQSIPVYEEEAHTTVYEYTTQNRWSTVKAPITLPENIVGTEITLPDVDYVEKSLTDMRTLVSTANDLVEDAADIRDEVAGYVEEGRQIHEEVVEAANKAYTYMEGAETYYKNTQELAEYLDKYQYKAYRTTIGNGGRTYTIAHGLQTDNIIVQCWPVGGGDPPAYTATRIDDSILQLDFSEDIGTLSMDVVISAIDRSLMEEVPIENVTNISFITPSEILDVLNGEEE